MTQGKTRRRQFSVSKRDFDFVRHSSSIAVVRFQWFERFQWSDDKELFDLPKFSIGGWPMMFRFSRMFELVICLFSKHTFRRCAARYTTNHCSTIASEQGRQLVDLKWVWGLPWIGAELVEESQDNLMNREFCRWWSQRVEWQDGDDDGDEEKKREEIIEKVTFSLIVRRRWLD